MQKYHEGQNINIVNADGVVLPVCFMILCYCTMEESCFLSACGSWTLWPFSFSPDRFRSVDNDIRTDRTMQSFYIVVFDCRVSVNFSCLAQTMQGCFDKCIKDTHFSLCLGLQMTGDGTDIEQSIHLLKRAVSRAISYRRGCGQGS